MVSILTAAIAASLGVMIYLAVPIVVTTAPVHVRQKVGTFYLKLAARALKQFSFVRRVLSGYDVLPISVDDEQKLLKTTLTSSTLGDDNEYRFADPDNRISRLYNKPVSLNYEGIPAAVDAELAELGYWVREKRNNEGLIHGDPMKNPRDVEVDPYVKMADSVRLVDPIDAFEVVPNDINPENIKTAEQKTKKRFEKYGSDISATDVLAPMLGFFAGAGGVVFIQYVNEKLLDGSGGGGGGPTIDVPMNPGMIDVTPAIDMAVMML